MMHRLLIGALVLAATVAARVDASAQAAPPAAMAAAPLPLAGSRVAASADECAVWQRELSFARSVEAHDAQAFASHLHPGTVFNAGAAEAERGRDAVAASWAAIVAGQALALRWRPGIVQIGGEAGVAVSRGPFILQSSRDGPLATRVGFYQTVWVRDGGGTWRVLFDAGASTPMAVADRAAAEAWVQAQPMSDCAGR